MIEKEAEEQSPALPVAGVARGRARTRASAASARIAVVRSN